MSSASSPETRQGATYIQFTVRYFSHLNHGGGHVLGDGERGREAGGPDAGHSHPASAQVEADAVVLLLRGRSEVRVSFNEPGGVEVRVEGQGGCQALR